MGKVLDAFYSNAVVYLAVVAALGALCLFLGLNTPGAFLFMLFGLLVVLWDAHTDPHIPEAPSIT